MGFASITLICLLVQAAASQNVRLPSDNAEQPAVESEGNLRLGDDEVDVDTRFFNIDLNTFTQQVAAAATGTIAGNALSGLAGNYLSGCSNRGKRSLLMHGLTKRQAIEVAKKQTGSSDPKVQERFLFCPQDLFPGGNNNNNNNNNNYCSYCNCRDWQCNRDCRKCSYGSTGWSSNSGSSGSNTGWSSNSGSSGNSGWSSNSGNTWSSSSLSCSSSSCCRNSSCRNRCRHTCGNSNSGNSWSSSSSNNNYGSGWRNNGVRGRTGEESENEAAAITTSQTDNSGEGDSVNFGGK